MIHWLLQLEIAATFLSGLDERSTLVARTLLAASASAIVVLIAGPGAIRWLADRCPETISRDSAQLYDLHRRKNRTPTMGGLVLVAGMFVGILIFAELSDPATLSALTVIAGMASIGAVDDVRKIRTGRRGLSARQKFAAQCATGALVAYIALAMTQGSKDPALAAHWLASSSALFAVPWITLVIVATANAVNLTDGLDGLAAGCVATTASALVGALLLRYGTAADTLVIASACLIGATIAFLRFNRFPARVFMGDTGSLALGGLLGLVAVMARAEWMLIVAGVVFVAETLSVIVQVAVFRLAGKRVLLCAPLHHHFQFQGWHETTVVRRFLRVSAVMAALTVAIVALENRRHQPALAGRPKALDAVPNRSSAARVITVSRQNSRSNRMLNISPSMANYLKLPSTEQPASSVPPSLGAE